MKCEAPLREDNTGLTESHKKFEIASEETEKKTVYAADDRAAAQEELQKLKAAFDDAIANSTPELGSEIKTRVGQRIRELDRAVEAMEEMAKED
ncbi:hypothetical protein MMC13_000625 [Lambiella insularis]|nr:hypothetical protein [Lambiella insularis]